MNVIDYLKVENKQCYIMGDFNINLTNYCSHTETQDYIDAMFEHSFIPIINKPTRITTTTATVIGNIYHHHVGREATKTALSLDCCSPFVSLL